MHNRKSLTWKLILCGFEHCVLLNFKASAAETGIFHGLKIVFLETTVHKLSVDSLLVYQNTVHEDTKQFTSYAQLKKTDVKVNTMRFQTLRSIEFQGLCSRKWTFSRSESWFLETTVHIHFVDSLLVNQKTVHEDTKQFISSA